MTEAAESAPTRAETDLIGTLEVPADALYGVQTYRAVLNFPLRDERSIGSYPSVVRGLVRVKQAAARANQHAGALDPRRADAIVEAAEIVLRDRLLDQFPVHRFHGGGGTSANMNANEVLANLAEERLGGFRGQYRLVHPINHVNLNQSTNDVYPTACRIAAIAEWPALDATLRSLAERLILKGAEFAHHLRMARTCLQDAVEISFDNLFQGYAAFLSRARERAARAVAALHRVNLGGTIVGRLSDVPEAYFSSVIPALRRVTVDEEYARVDNLFDAAQNPDDVAVVSSALDLLARGLVKISKDLRLMSSGPETGFQEIVLPALQPGSSIMPGKINPVIPEFVIQLGMQVTGHHLACVSALDHGELDLNVWEGVMIFNTLDSMSLLNAAVAALEEKCVRGIDINVEQNARNVDAITPWLVRLAKRYGYSEMNDMCVEAAGDLGRLRRLLHARE